MLSRLCSCRCHLAAGIIQAQLTDLASRVFRSLTLRALDIIEAVLGGLKHNFAKSEIRNFREGADKRKRNRRGGGVTTNRAWISALNVVKVLLIEADLL